MPAVDMSSSRPGSLQQVPLQSAGISLIDGMISTRAIRRYTAEPIPDRGAGTVVDLVPDGH